MPRFFDTVQTTTPLPSAATPGCANTAQTACALLTPLRGTVSTAQTTGALLNPLPRSDDMATPQQQYSSTTTPPVGNNGGGPVTPPTLAKRGSSMSWQPSSGSGGAHAQARSVRHKAEHTSSGSGSAPGRRERADGGAWVSLVALTGTPQQQSATQLQQQQMPQQQQPSQVMHGTQQWQQVNTQGWGTPQCGGGAHLSGQQQLHNGAVRSGGSAHLGGQQPPRVSGGMVSGGVHSGGMRSSGESSGGGAAAGLQPYSSGGMLSGGMFSNGSAHLGWQQPHSGGGVPKRSGTRCDTGALTQGHSQRGAHTGGRSSGMGGMQQQGFVFAGQQHGFMPAGAVASQMPGFPCSFAQQSVQQQQQQQQQQ
eukprot:CAMPEP_0202353200 /NCGR_PEP_ID=MMETSP1126-20121109/9065_1 /ASSEMBLY_ACC=CAM_ASM_000457 /TAXON_ID=3047 /ORGANISM="Dunaliella tertiolecta, Strain CCMP1320" /LENGTH=364 /DNA_ID=CAMNT_0048945519 /DNA_START=84 /DNA_END=1175 /DNA_ORIENTATION=-